MLLQRARNARELADEARRQRVPVTALHRSRIAVGTTPLPHVSQTQCVDSLILIRR